MNLVGTVHVDCAYQSNYQGTNTYVIGIAGTYFKSNHLRAFYLAKFSTKYNLTEYVAISNQPDVMEDAKAVKVDLLN